MDRQQVREAVASEVRAEAARQRASQSTIALLLGTSTGTVSRKMRATYGFDIDELCALASAWDVPVVNFLCAVRDLNPEPAD